MLKFKRLLIQPNGMITSGYFQYTLDPDSGNITYEGRVDAHLFFFSKSFPFSGTTQVDPKNLKSADIKTGDKFQFGNLDVSVKEVSKDGAVCDVSVNANGINSNGIAIFDLSGPTISLVSLDASGNAMGYQIHLVAHD